MTVDLEESEGGLSGLHSHLTPSSCKSMDLQWCNQASSYSNTCLFVFHLKPQLSSEAIVIQICLFGLFWDVKENNGKQMTVME